MSNLFEKDDPEPERYYDWILWKFRKEKEMEKQLELDFTSKLGEGITTTDSIIRREMYEMQKCINGLQIRIKELAEENYELKKRVMPDLSDKIPEVTGKQMPTYTIRNKEFGTEKDVFCTYSELQEMLKSNDIEQVLSAPALVGDHVVKRMDGGMKEVFSKIGDKHPGSPLADRFSSGGSNAQKKVTEVAKKHGLLKKDGGQNMSKVKLQTYT